jgi:hypothetical protein
MRGGEADVSGTQAGRDGKGGPRGIDASFGPGAVRLSGREWLVAAAIVAAVLAALPFAWKRIEPLPPGPDLRLPYRLGSDYGTYARLVEQAAARDATLVVGDSVVWGHYVAKDETLSGRLNALAGADRFANLGVDGIHPAALEGLVAYYGGAAAGRRVVLHCNLLWMSSERHDLRVAKEFAFNHPGLVPQFVPWIPCYREPVAGRLAIVIGRRLPFSGWANHLRVAYWDDLDLASWTLENPYKCPAEAVTLRLPSPDEPPSPAPDARPWTAKGIARFAPAWVDLDGSLQWAALRRTVEMLRARGSRVFVLVGPFNEPMLEPASLAAYKERTREVAAWLGGRGIPCRAPAALPSQFYADASHPLADGYRLLAEGLLADEEFRRFCELGPAGEGRAP